MTVFVGSLPSYHLRRTYTLTFTPHRTDSTHHEHKKTDKNTLGHTSRTGSVHPHAFQHINRHTKSHRHCDINNHTHTHTHTHTYSQSPLFLIIAATTPPFYYHTARGSAASSLASIQHFLSPMNSHLPFSSPLSITIIAIITTTPPLQRPHQSRLIREDFHMG